MSKDSVPITPTPHLVVPKWISSDLADGTESAPRRNCEAKPVLQAQAEFLISQVKIQGTGRDSVQPVASMSDSRRESQGL